MPKYIDADAYIKYCEDNWIVLNVDAVKKQPSSDVEPVRHGKWIDEHPGSPLDPRMRCSVCEHVDVPMWSWCFCPMCGAKMGAELPKEEDDG